MANSDLVLKILPLIDDLEKAFESAAEDLKKTPWFEGLALIVKKMESLFEEAGVEEIKAVGEKFDPNYHQAVLHEEVEGEDADTVVHVLQKGYKMHGRVIRPAMVKVAK